jgi:hypothetical protein
MDIPSSKSRRLMEAVEAGFNNLDNYLARYDR